MNNEPYKVGDERWCVVDTRRGPKLLLFKCTSLSPKGKAAHWRSTEGDCQKRTDNPDNTWVRLRKTRANAARHYIHLRLHEIQVTLTYLKDRDVDIKAVTSDIVSAVNQATEL